MVGFAIWRMSAQMSAPKQLSGRSATLQRNLVKNSLRQFGAPALIAVAAVATVSSAQPRGIIQVEGAGHDHKG
jgi:hypothetical protein